MLIVKKGPISPKKINYEGATYKEFVPIQTIIIRLLKFMNMNTNSMNLIILLKPKMVLQNLIRKSWNIT